jgi:hypothetical protein
MPVDPCRYYICAIAPFVRNLLPCLILLTLIAMPVSSQNSGGASGGLAWEVRGSWQIGGKSAPIHTGDYISAGSLLQPDADVADHSITVLLPDGQLFLYECFTTEDCSRGFRVPSLYRKPEPFAVDMLAGIHKALIASATDLQVGSIVRQASRLPRDEVIASLDPDNRVHVEGLAARLSNGHYTYDVRPLDHAHHREFHLATEKNGSSISIELPASGLYLLTITDSLNTPRIDLFVAAVEPPQAATFEKSYREAAALMKEWNQYYQGWPVHDFQRAYLESLVLGINVLVKDKSADATSGIASQEGLHRGRADAVENLARVTAEPVFTPKPGLFEKNIAITLQCKTPGATIHFTVDGSQPIASSPAYRAPIVVKGSELTVKSFATVTGKKDSPVVTGIFRIQE